MSEPEPGLTTAEDLAAPPVTEPELQEAVSDLDAAPTMASPPAEPSELPAAEPSPPPPVQPEPPRRRSTVREPAPLSGAGPAEAPLAAPAAPQPIVTEIGESSEDVKPPRRSGWWSRRIAGG